MPKSIQSESERLSALCRAANANATREHTIPFGANVSRPQMLAVEQFLKGRDILKFLACTEKQLRDFSRNEISYAALPVKTQQRLRQISATYSKPWARKSATITFVIHRSRKNASRKRAAKPAVSDSPKGES